MRLETLTFFNNILMKKFDSLDRSLRINPKSEILTIRTMITTIMNETMTPANAQKLGELGRKYNEMLRLDKRQQLHWEQWQKERRALGKEIAELDEQIKSLQPPTLFDAKPADVKENPDLSVPGQESHAA